ncbi:MAG: hypothetical protein ACD_58C00118G0009 [uncultured bacterium]|nr:MAG: hypothetical protein ACD_58C00118G0009 [uncultured bacterium]
MKKTLLIKFAELISIIFNPFALGLAILVMAIVKSKMPQVEQLVWIITVTVLNGAVLALIYWIFINAGYIFDDSVQNKKILHGRLVLLTLLLVLVTIELLVLVSTSAYQPLLAVYIGGVLTLVLGLLITNFWKISWHSTMITFFTGMFVFMYNYRAWPLVLVFITVIWSRILLKRHTIWQLTAGVLLSIIVIIAVFGYFGLFK